SFSSSALPAFPVHFSLVIFARPYKRPKPGVHESKPTSLSVPSRPFGTLGKSKNLDKMRLGTLGPHFSPPSSSSVLDHLTTDLHPVGPIWIFGPIPVCCPRFSVFRQKSSIETTKRAALVPYGGTDSCRAWDL